MKQPKENAVVVVENRLKFNLMSALLCIILHRVPLDTIKEIYNG
jgi:hypothetical protein